MIMEISTEKLKELLVRPGHIGEADFESVLKEAKEKRRPLEELLVDKELITDDRLGRLIAEELDYKFVDLRKEKTDEEVLNLIPELVARSKGAVAFAAADLDADSADDLIALAAKKNICFLFR